MKNQSIDILFLQETHQEQEAMETRDGTFSTSITPEDLERRRKQKKWIGSIEQRLGVGIEHAGVVSVLTTKILSVVDRITPEGSRLMSLTINSCPPIRFINCYAPPHARTQRKSDSTSRCKHGERLRGR